MQSNVQSTMRTARALEIPAYRRPGVLVRWEAQVDQGQHELGCWIWTGYRGPCGYGNIKVAGRTERAHRVAYALFRGPVPAGQLVMHRCDNGVGGCVRPEHLELGTPARNTGDAVARGLIPLGTRTWLTEQDVIDIRRAWQGGEDRRDIAARYGLSASAVGNIVHGRRWGHVHDPVEAGAVQRRAAATYRALDLGVDERERLRIAARWERYVDKSAHPRGCWIWRGYRAATGYGGVKVRGRSDGAHRVAYALFRGPVPARRVVMHSCDNGPGGCVRPDHLQLGTSRQNSRDAAERGLLRRGERHHKTNLRPADVLAILGALSDGEGQASIARRYGVTRAAICNIAHGRRWAHVA